MSVPAWYETYLLLHQANVHPFNEPASIPFLSDVWNVNSIFITPHSDEEPPSLATCSLLPSVWDTPLVRAAPRTPRAPLTPEDTQASLLPSQNQDHIPAYISAVPQQGASASFGASNSPLKNFGVAHHQQENAGTQIKEGEDLEKKTRRIASKLHIMASKKQLDPAKVSDDEARALIQLQLKTNVPLLPPWYRHASRQ